MPSQVALLARRAEGSPLFLIELLQALRHGGDIEALPHSVEGLIGAAAGGGFGRRLSV
jgi:hypothetical protein